MNPTLNSIQEWILKNRRGKSFYGYSPGKILNQLLDCSRNESMLVIMDNDEIVGIACGRWLPDNVLWIDDILTTRPKVVKHMMLTFQQRWPSFSIQGLHRTGRTRNFTNTQKLTNRL